MENVPQFIREAKNGDFLTTKFGFIILVQRVEIGLSDYSGKAYVKVYYYFYYDSDEDAISMNEWLTGFFGPKFEDGFYRPSTEEEKQKLINLMKQRGYEWNEDLQAPSMTSDEFHRINQQIHII